MLQMGDIKQRRPSKQNNRKIILDFMRNNGMVSIADISYQVNISKTTVKKVIDFYLENHLLIEAGKGSSTDEGGKRPALFRFNQDFGIIYSIHLGPTFIYAAVTDMKAGIIHSKYLTIKKISAKAAVKKIADIITSFMSLEWLSERKPVRVVIALPGITDPQKGISIFSPHFVHWGQNVPMKEMLLKLIPLDCPVLMDDVNRYQAFAEMQQGMARGKENFIIVDAIEEGVGAGVIVNGTMRHGSQNLSGEIGHMVLDPDNGPECICGGRGCFEALVALKRIKKMIKDGQDTNPDSLIFKNCETDEIKLDDLFSAFREGDAFAVEIFDDLTTWFAIGLNNVIMVNDPEMIIIQGIYTKTGQAFLDLLKAKIDQMSYPRLSRNAEIAFSTLGNDRGVIGAAVFGVWHYFEHSWVYKEKVEEME